MDDAPSRFCLDCRTLLDEDTACDAGRFHRVVSLADEEGAERARAQAWGPPDLRKRAADAAKVGGIGALLEGPFDGCSASGCPVELGGGLEALGALMIAVVAAAVVFFVVALLYWLAATLYGWVRRRLTRLRPTGVRVALPRRREHLGGTIVAGSPTPSPLGDTAGVAWGLLAESSDAIGEGGVMLSAGRTAGFSVRLDDGRTIEVPPGRVRVAPDGEGWSRVPVRALKAWLAQIDRRFEDELHPPIPADRGRSVALSVGDRVELSVELDRVAAVRGGYRDGAARLRVRGVPVLARA